MCYLRQDDFDIIGYVRQWSVSTVFFGTNLHFINESNFLFSLNNFWVALIQIEIFFRITILVSLMIYDELISDLYFV